MPLPQPRKPTVSHFYKYSSNEHLDRLKTILLDHELYLPNLSELNDDNDGLPKLARQSEEEMCQFLIHYFVKNHPTMPLAELKHHEAIIRFNVNKHGPTALYPHIVKALDSQLRDFKVYSMTKRWDLPNLWALYANGHRGYCLEFRNVGALFEYAREVAYLPSDQMTIAVADPSLLNGDFLFCKTLNWSNEEEVRLVSARKQANKVRINPGWLTRIILGKAMSSGDETTIREWARLRDPELSVVNTYYDPVERRIRIKQVPGHESGLPTSV